MDKSYNVPKRKLWKRVRNTSVICLIAGTLFLWSVSVFNAIKQDVDSKTTRSQLAELRSEIRVYIERNECLPPLPIFHDCSDKPSWRTYLDKSYIYGFENSIFLALLFKDCVWTKKLNKRDLYGKHGHEFVVVALHGSSRQLSWQRACDLIVTDESFYFQGTPDKVIDLRGAHALRLNGNIERIPNNMTIKEICRRLKSGISFVE